MKVKSVLIVCRVYRHVEWLQEAAEPPYHPPPVWYASQGEWSLLRFSRHRWYFFCDICWRQIGRKWFCPRLTPISKIGAFVSIFVSSRHCRWSPNFPDIVCSRKKRDGGVWLCVCVRRQRRDFPDFAFGRFVCDRRVFAKDADAGLLRWWAFSFPEWFENILPLWNCNAMMMDLRDLGVVGDFYEEE